MEKVNLGTVPSSAIAILEALSLYSLQVNNTGSYINRRCKNNQPNAKKQVQESQQVQPEGNSPAISSIWVTSHKCLNLSEDQLLAVQHIRCNNLKKCLIYLWVNNSKQVIIKQDCKVLQREALVRKYHFQRCT